MTEGKKRKVVLFIDSLVRGGAQRQLVECARNLDGNLFEPIVLVYHDIPQFRSDLEDHGITIVLIPKMMKVDVIFLMKLVSFFRNEKPDIIHSYLNTPNMWARIAGTLAGVRCIITSERDIEIQFSVRKMGIEKILHHFSKHIAVNAEAIKDILTNRLRIPEQKIKVIHNGVDTDRFCKYDRQKAERIRASFGYCQEDFVVTLPGRMEFTKNHICLLRALRAIGNGNNIKVLFVGNENDAALKSELMRFVDANGLTRKVRFAGRQDDMVSVYNLSDAVVLPSLREGFPNVLLEAMSVGIPVIASDIADNRKIVIDGENGYLFRSDNHAELADILQKMIGESSERLFDMGEVGREMARNKYNVIKMAKAYQDLYKECI